MFVDVIGQALIAPGASSDSMLVERLRSGRALAREIDWFDSSGFPSTLACRIDDYDPSDMLKPVESKRMPRAVQLMVTTAVRAFRGCEGALDGIVEDPMIIVGTGFGGLTMFEDMARIIEGEGLRRASPLTVPMIMPNAAAAEIARRLPTHGPALCVSNACASGAVAVAHGVHAIRSGRARVVLAGGGESLLTRTVFAAFARTSAMSSARSPAAIRGPFDEARDGFVMGEGAGFVVLAAPDVTAQAGLEPIGQVLGVGESTDAYNIAAPEPSGAGAAAAMLSALADAGRRPEDIGHVSAHGTATELGDLAESQAISKVFGEGGVPVTATKGVIGHSLGGSGVLALLAARASAEQGVVPPVGALRTLDGAMTIDAVVGEARRIEEGRPALVNTFAFGGHNVSIVVGPKTR